LLRESYGAVFHGYSWRTLYSALPGSPWVCALGGSLAVVGALIVIHRARRVPASLSGLFLWTWAPFPFLYAAVFARLANAPSKPQYLILMAVPLLACIGITVDALRHRLQRASVAVAVTVYVVLLAVPVVPMFRASTASLARADKRDWRGALTHLADHAQPGDAFAAVSSDQVPTKFHTVVGGLGRYFSPPSPFLRIELDCDPKPLSLEPWSRPGGTVWLLSYTDPLYEGRDLLPPPQRPPADMQVHAFHGLFLLEVRGERLAAERLVKAIEFLYRDLPDGRSLVAPGVFAGRFLRQSGRDETADRLFRLARRQCTADGERAVLDRDYLPPAGRLAGAGRDQADAATD
jgi:hypothetical protein